MKKKILLAGAVVSMAAAAVTGFSVYNKTNVSDLLNANVEALASGEGGSVYCPGGSVECAKVNVNGKTHTFYKS